MGHDYSEVRIAERNGVDMDGTTELDRGVPGVGGAHVQGERQVVPDAVFAEIRHHFDERQIVELTVLIGTYNMNARVLQALQLDLEPRAP